MDISDANFVTGPGGDPAPAVPARVASYSAVAIALHWIIALCILGQIALGWQLHHIPMGPGRFVAFQWHKSIGITILLLSLIRLGWRILRPAPPESDLPHWQQVASRLVHWALYFIMIALPVTGWIMVSSSKLPIPTLLYGVVPWPALPGLGSLAPDAKAAWNAAGNVGHSALVYVTVAMLVLHLSAVAKHQLVDRDDIFARMAPGARSGWKEPRLWVVVALALAAIVAGRNMVSGGTVDHHGGHAAPAGAPLAPVTSAPAPTPSPTIEATPAKPAAGPLAWHMQDGRLRFATTWSGAPINGSFSRWSVDILFSPDQLEQSMLTVRIDIASASTGDSQRDAALPTSDWFDTTAHPSATFSSKKIRATGGDGYVASGTLELRGIRHSLAVPFTVKIRNGIATARGAFMIDRTLFGIGQGDWSATDQIPAGVNVSFAVKADALPTGK